MENGLGVVAAMGKVVVEHYGHDRRDGRNDNCLDEMIANGVQRLQHDVPEVKNAIADKVNAAMAQDNANARSMEHMICGTERNLAEGQREIQRDVVQNRFEGVQSENRIIRQIDTETDIIKERLTNFERSTDKQFCETNMAIKDSERRILDRLTSDKIDEKNDLIAELRAKCARTEDTLSFSNQNNELKSMINSVLQEQKFSSKVTQFGLGNVALPTQTANQG